jgi:hypothetical protein
VYHDSDLGGTVLCVGGCDVGSGITCAGYPITWLFHDSGAIYVMVWPAREGTSDCVGVPEAFTVVYNRTSTACSGAAATAVASAVVAAALALALALALARRDALTRSFRLTWAEAGR